MHLSYVAENLVSNVLTAGQSTSNILYEPHNSCIDNILWSLPHNFFIHAGAETTKNTTNNTIRLPTRLQHLYAYNFYLNFSLEKHAHNASIATAYHIPSITIIDQVRAYKKEDRHIINQKTKNITKIFLSQEAYESMGKPDKSYVINLGIPDNTDNIGTRNNDTCIIDSGMVSKQIYQILSNNQIDCDLVSTSDLNISTLQKYKICIDISPNYRYNLLYAMSAGCTPITLKHNAQFTEYMYHATTPEEIIALVKSIDNPPNQDNIFQYLLNSFNYEIFASAMNQIFLSLQKEVFIQ